MADKHVAVVLGRRTSEWKTNLSREEQDRVLTAHGEHMRQYAQNVAHVIAPSGAEYDEAIIVEADDEGTIREILERFQNSEKAGFYQIVQTITGIKPERMQEAHHFYY